LEGIFHRTNGESRKKIVKRDGRRGGGEEEDLDLEETRKAIRKLKNRKTMGGDNIPNETYKYEEEEVEKWTWEICRRVWRREKWLKQWKEGEIISLIKKEIKRGDRRLQRYNTITITL